jgi:hypothetical protein
MDEYGVSQELAEVSQSRFKDYPGKSVLLEVANGDLSPENTGKSDWNI